MKWTVGSKIGGGFAAVAAIFLIVGAVSYYGFVKLLDTGDWVTHTYKVLGELNGLQQALTDAETAERGYVITSQDSFLDEYHAGLDAIQPHFDAIRDLTRDNPAQQDRLNTLDPMIKRRVASLADVLSQVQTKGIDAAKSAVIANDSKQKMDDIRKIISDMQEEESSLLKTRTDETTSSANFAELTIVVGVFAALVLASIIGFAIARGISQPLRQLTIIAERVAAGDLSVNAAASHRGDEVGVLTRTVAHMTQSLRGMAEVAGKIAEGDLRVNVKAQSDKDLLGNAFASMVVELRRMVSQMTEGVNTLTTSANQISTTTTQFASSSAETATAVTETTTTVEEVRQTAQLASQKSKYVSDSTHKAAQTAQNGKQSLDTTVAEIQSIRRQMESIADGMVRLSEQNKTVGQIITSVDDLAAQSNILAVNAAIEAAKAGEHGKGFSVVAQEVRSLAEQSKQATNQVRNILGEIQKATNSAVMFTEQGSKAVEVGVKQAGETGQSITTLVSSVTEAAQAATQIAASSQQQLVGMDQVAAAMESIKQASAQNVASAKQLETAAHGLKALGQQVKQLIDRYKL